MILAWGYTRRERTGPGPSGSFTFVVRKAEFEVTPSASAGVPGDQVTVRFRSRADDVRILGCEIRLGRSIADCAQKGEWFATVAVPPTGSKEPLQTTLAWSIDYIAGKSHRDATSWTSLPFRIDPLPPPGFSVEGDRKTVGPGESVRVRFAAATAGVTVVGCSVTLVERVPCDPKTLVADVAIPSGQAQGDTLLTWDLHYVSTRPGEDKGIGHGELSVEVVVQPRQFVVTIQPGEAAPGEPVTLTFTSVTPGVGIVGCLAAFAHTTGDVCRRSSKRWFARTRVPSDARPGTAVLRWGIVARNAAGADVADNGALDYAVLPAPSRSPATGTTTPSPQAEPADVQPLAAADFYATADPESARPGDRVVVDVSPTRPGVEVGGCRVAFSGHARTPCRPAAGGWSATVTVPRDARPGTLALRWDATAAGAGGSDGGTIDYEILGADPPAPAFSVLPRPASATAGEKIELAYASLVDGVDIADCGAGLTPDATSACRRTADGWVAQLTIPASTPVGRTQVHWQLTYRQSGGAETGTTDGLTLFEVLPHPPRKGRLWHLVSRGLIGAAALVLPLAFTPVRRRLGRMFRRDGDGNDNHPPEQITAVGVERPENTVVTVRDHDVPAMSLVGVLPRIDPILHEEDP